MNEKKRERLLELIKEYTEDLALAERQENLAREGLNHWHAKRVEIQAHLHQARQMLSFMLEKGL